MHSFIWDSISISSFVLFLRFLISAVPFSYNSTILFFLFSIVLFSLWVLVPVYSGFIFGLNVHSFNSFFSSSSFAFWISYTLFLSCNNIFSIYFICSSLSALFSFDKSLVSLGIGSTLSLYFSYNLFVFVFIAGLKSNCLLSCIKVFISLEGFLLFL